jgi:hypothetical protein
MTADFFVLCPDKAFIHETSNKLQVLNNHLAFLPGNIAPLSTSEIRDTIEENMPVHWQTKYENADLNFETITELTGYFTRLEDLERKCTMPPIRPVEVS